MNDEFINLKSKQSRTIKRNCKKRDNLPYTFTFIYYIVAQYIHKFVEKNPIWNTATMAKVQLEISDSNFFLPFIPLSNSIRKLIRQRK